MHVSGSLLELEAFVVDLWRGTPSRASRRFSASRIAGGPQTKQSRLAMSGTSRLKIGTPRRSVWSSPISVPGITWIRMLGAPANFRSSSREDRVVGCGDAIEQDDVVVRPERVEQRA